MTATSRTLPPRRHPETSVKYDGDNPCKPACVGLRRSVKTDHQKATLPQQPHCWGFYCAKRLVFRQNENPARAGGWRQGPEFAGITLNPVRATGDQRAEGRL
jgi:hypothetical protein